MGRLAREFSHFVLSYMSPWVELLDIVLASLLRDGPACQTRLQPRLNAKKFFCSSLFLFSIWDSYYSMLDL